MSDSNDAGEPRLEAILQRWTDRIVEGLAAGEPPAALVRGHLGAAVAEALAERTNRDEERLRLILDASKMGTWDLDVSTWAMETNERFRELFGLTSENAHVHEQRLDQVHPEDLGPAMQAIKDAAAGVNGGIYLQHYRTRSLPDGGWRWLEARGQMSDQAGGQPGRLLGILIDVTERKQLEAERERARTQVTEVLESMGDAFFAIDQDWRFVLVNAKYEELSRRRREEILGHLFWEAFPDAENPASWYFQSYHRCMTERVPVSFVDDYPALDLWLDVRVYPTDDGGIAAFFRDVSSERRAAFLRQRQAEFEQHLVGIVSHDLRTPLNAIALGAGALLGSEQLDGTSLRIASRIRSSAERAGRMIRDLLDFTQARLGGGIPVRPGPLDLHALVQQVVEEVDASTPGREIELLQQGDGQVDGDSDRLAQAVGNLLTNALKYSPAGSPVRVETLVDGPWLSLAIHNQGAPIAPAKLASIFEPMQRAAADIDRLGRSVGLGLYIVKHIAEAHHGTIEVASSEAEGTTFTLRIPHRRGAPGAGGGAG